MIIQDTDYIIEPSNDFSLIYDLKLLKKKLTKNKEEKMEFESAGYGLKLDKVVAKIAQNRIDLKHPDESVTLETFLKELKEEEKKIRNIIEEFITNEEDRMD